MLLLSEILLSTAQASLCVGEVRSLESTASPCGEFWSHISTCILTGYRLNKSLHLTTWGSEWSCASGFATRLTLRQAFLTMSGFRTRHIFCYQVTWTLRTTFSGVVHPMSTVCKGHYTVKWTAWVAISKHGDPKGGMREGHRELCQPDPNVPAAPESSFGAHFLSASETKSFCTTDLKLWRCLLHRLDLMQLKFYVNVNKILEVIRFLVMTVFLCHPVL